MDSYIKTNLERAIYFITISRPEKKNAINLEMYSQLAEALCSADNNDEVKVIFISGDGGCFSSGNDLSDFLYFTEDIESSPVIKFINTIAETKKPIVAAVSGLAIGIGVTMLLHCDIVVAGKNTLFQMPFVNLGLCPEAGATFLLPICAGYHNAAKLMLLGDSFSAEEALDAGLVSFLADEEAVYAFSKEIALKLAVKSSGAVITTKRLLKEGFKAQLKSHIKEESKSFLSLLKTKEVSANIKVFLERKGG